MSLCSQASPRQHSMSEQIMSDACNQPSPSLSTKLLCPISSEHTSGVEYPAASPLSNPSEKDWDNTKLGNASLPEARKRRKHQRLHPDGFAWIKYGEKSLLATGVLREYYKCRNWQPKEKGGTSCIAKKIVDRPMLLAPSNIRMQARRGSTTAVAVGPTCTQVVVAAHNHPRMLDGDSLSPPTPTSVWHRDAFPSNICEPWLEVGVEESSRRGVTVQCPDPIVGADRPSPMSTTISSVEKVHQASTLPHAPADARMLAKYNQALMADPTPARSARRRCRTPRGPKRVTRIQVEVPDLDIAQGLETPHGASSPGKCGASLSSSHPSTPSNPGHSSQVCNPFLRHGCFQSHSGSNPSSHPRNSLQDIIHEGLSLLSPEELHSPPPPSLPPPSLKPPPLLRALGSNLKSESGVEKVLGGNPSFFPQPSHASHGFSCTGQQKTDIVPGVRKRRRDALALRSKTVPNRRLEDVSVTLGDWLEHVEDDMHSPMAQMKTEPSGGSFKEASANQHLLNKTYSLPMLDVATPRNEEAGKPAGDSCEGEQLFSLDWSPAELSSLNLDGNDTQCCVDGNPFTGLEQQPEEDAFSLLSSMLEEGGIEIERAGSPRLPFDEGEQRPSPSMVPLRQGATVYAGDRGEEERTGDRETTISPRTQDPRACASQTGSNVSSLVNLVRAVALSPAEMRVSQSILPSAARRSQGHSEVSLEVEHQSKVAALVHGAQMGDTVPRDRSGNAAREVLKLIVAAAAAQEVNRAKEGSFGREMELRGDCHPLTRVDSASSAQFSTSSEQQCSGTARIPGRSPVLPQGPIQWKQTQAEEDAEESKKRAVLALLSVIAATAGQGSPNTQQRSTAYPCGPTSSPLDAQELQKKVVMEILGVHTKNRGDSTKPVVSQFRADERQSLVNSHSPSDVLESIQNLSSASPALVWVAGASTSNQQLSRNADVAANQGNVELAARVLQALNAQVNSGEQNTRGMPKGIICEGHGLQRIGAGLCKPDEHRRLGPTVAAEVVVSLLQLLF